MKTNHLNRMLLTLTLLATLPSVNAETIGRFQVKQGIATDSATGLIWMRCLLGMEWDGENCVGNAISYNWEQALQKPKGFSYAGYNDWRLPTLDELETLIDDNVGNPHTNTPFIKRLVFPRSICNDNTSCYSWSSSPYEYAFARHGYITHQARVVDFYHGYIPHDRKSRYYAVRLVRGGQ